jgi:DNA-directed RNA polymerase subunit RPC12/RpoP
VLVRVNKKEKGMQTSIQTVSMHIFVQTGSEGPKHDPYAFKEITITRKDKETVVLHMGLAEYLRIGKREIKGYDEEGLEAIKRATITEIGLTEDQIEKAIQRLRSRCPKCSGRNIESTPGFPGETLYMCSNCHTIVGSDIDMSAIE